MAFDFTGMVECDRCGEQKPDGEDCEKCSEKPLRRYHFEFIDGDRVETVWAINAERAWHELLKQVEEPLPWRCVETDAMTLDLVGMDVLEVWNKYHNT